MPQGTSIGFFSSSKVSLASLCNVLTKWSMVWSSCRIDFCQCSCPIVSNTGDVRLLDTRCLTGTRSAAGKAVTAVSAAQCKYGSSSSQQQQSAAAVSSWFCMQQSCHVICATGLAGSDGSQPKRRKRTSSAKQKASAAGYGQHGGYGYYGGDANGSQHGPKPKSKPMHRAPKQDDKGPCLNPACRTIGRPHAHLLLWCTCFA